MLHEDRLLLMKLKEIMTADVVTAAQDKPVFEVAQMMRDRNVGSVVVVGKGKRPVAMVTDRDLTISALADRCDLSDPVAGHCTQPVVSGDPEMEIEEAAALMVQNHIRRLPVMDGKELIGIVTLDDIAIRTGNLEIAKQMTGDIVEAALPNYYFDRHD